MTLSLAWMPKADAAARDAAADDEVVERVRAGETDLYEILMRRYNQRLYRVARSILGDEAEAEDVMQETYVRAYQHLDQFAGTAKFSTWLTRIAVHEALQRARRRGRMENLDSVPEGRLQAMAHSDAADPERQTYDREMKVVLEKAVDALPESYRSVFVLRAVEELSVAETAACLNLSEETVKTRHHRARFFLRNQLHERIRAAAPEVFSFHLSRCDRVVQGVLRRIGGPQ